MLDRIPSTEPTTWVVVNTQPHREDFALLNLDRQGFVSYCPMMLKRIRHARRAYDAKRPLFPGYVFVAYNPRTDRWRSLLGTYGVRSVIRAGEMPALLDGGFVSGLRARELDGVVCKPTQPYAVGQSVAVMGGPFDGIIGQIIELRDNDRVLLLLDLLNGSAKAQISTDDLRPAKL